LNSILERITDDFLARKIPKEYANDMIQRATERAAYYQDLVKRVFPRGIISSLRILPGTIADYIDLKLEPPTNRAMFDKAVEYVEKTELPKKQKDELIRILNG
jgi:hypothetical protein